MKQSIIDQIYMLNCLKNVTIYTYSHLKNEIEKYVSNESIDRICCVDEKEFHPADDHLIYIWSNSIFEADKLISIELAFKYILKYLEERNVWHKGYARSDAGPVKLIQRKPKQGFYLENVSKILEARKLFKKRCWPLYDDIIHSIETGDLSRLQRHKSGFEQYNHPDVHFGYNEMIVDGGAYNFRTARPVRNPFRCYSFEANKNNMEKYLSNLSEEDRKTIKVINYALWDKDFEEVTLTDRKYASTISEKGTIKCKTIKLDTYIDKQHTKKLFPIDCIKLDIEGSEINALNGASKTISSDKPRLMIAVYHNPEDIFEIPLLIHKLNAKYPPFDLGYHSNYSWLDRVILYADK